MVSTPMTSEAALSPAVALHTVGVDQDVADLRGESVVTCHGGVADAHAIAHAIANAAGSTAEVYRVSGIASCPEGTFGDDLG